MDRTFKILHVQPRENNKILFTCSDGVQMSAIWRYALLKERDGKKLFFQPLDPILAQGTIFNRISTTILHLQLNCCYREK